MIFEQTAAVNAERGRDGKIKEGKRKKLFHFLGIRKMSGVTFVI